MPTFSGTGAVLPGTPSSTLPPGPLTVTIASAPGENDGIDGAISENVMAQCVYPDGFVKNHQTNSPQDLTEKVLNLLRNRYGAAQVTVTRMPDEVVAGAAVELEV